MPRKPTPRVSCDYCAHSALLCRWGTAHYPYRVDYGPVWICPPCRAWVGCHRNSARHAPLGRLANAELRVIRASAHRWFDALWQAKMVRDRCSQSHARRAGYTWLADQLGIAFEDCHIGYFDVPMCWRVVEICSRFDPSRRYSTGAGESASPPSPPPKNLAAAQSQPPQRQL